MTATVKRRDITVTEERDYEMRFADISISEESATRTTWTATLDGRLSTGESVSMSRHGATSKEALNLLAEAIAAESWSIE